jgi:hypothetical protein
MSKILKKIAISLVTVALSVSLIAQSNLAQFKQLFLAGNYDDLLGPLVDYTLSLNGNSSFEVDYMTGMTLCNVSGHENDGRSYLRLTQSKFAVSAQVFDGRRVSLSNAMNNCGPSAGVGTGISQPSDPGMKSVMKRNFDLRSQQQILHDVKTVTVKKSMRSMGAVRAQAVLPAGSVYDGSYNMVHDGWKGQLFLRGPAGEYVDSNGKRFRVTARFFPDHKIVFYVIGLGGENADGTGGQKFEAYLFTQTKDGMAGIAWWQNQPFGFYAVRK